MGKIRNLLLPVLLLLISLGCATEKAAGLSSSQVTNFDIKSVVVFQPQVSMVVRSFSEVHGLNEAEIATRETLESLVVDDLQTRGFELKRASPTKEMQVFGAPVYGDLALLAQQSGGDAFLLTTAGQYKMTSGRKVGNAIGWTGRVLSVPILDAAGAGGGVGFVGSYLAWSGDLFLKLPRDESYVGFTLCDTATGRVLWSKIVYAKDLSSTNLLEMVRMGLKEFPCAPMIETTNRSI